MIQAEATVRTPRPRRFASEDRRRLRKGHGAENFSRLCRLSPNRLKAEKSLKIGLATKRLNCGWDHDYLLKVLMNLE